jgi:CheY-like chemotaxis protein
MGAMKVLEADNSIEVLFSDVIMPGGMNGDELAKWALKQFPHIKVLLTTASSSEIQETMSSHGDDIHWLRKPYSRDELAQHIRSVLDTGIHRA